MTTPSKSSQTSGSIKGYLDVKIPARKRKSISLFRVQVWKRRCWVVIRADRSPAESTVLSALGCSRSETVNLSVEIYTQHEGSNHPTEGTILHLDLVHKIRRAKSKSHPYAFEVCGRRGEALLYLSGCSESETQKWMASIRNILWPPNHLEAIQNAYPESWEVSAISVGQVGGDWTSLGGLYGCLAVSNANIVVKDIHNGTTKIEWPLITVQRIYVSTGGELEDEGKIFIVQTRSSHPCGETYLYFFSLELSDLLEGLHSAVSRLINKNGGDDTSVLSDLSELSGALNTVVALPPRLQDSTNGLKMRKSTSVLDISELNSCVIPRLSCSQNNLTGDERSEPGEPTTHAQYLRHLRRRSMSETNLNKLCLDETDEELDSREDDLEDADLRHMDVPKDRTSSSGSYNSYRSNDSGVKLSASPSNYGDGARIAIDHATRRLVSKSDSLDSGVRTYNKDDIMRIEIDDHRRCENYEEFSKRGSKGALGEEPDVEAKVGAWCLQSAKARKSLLVKNLSTCGHKDYVRMKGLSRTLSESYKEVVDRKNSTEDYKRTLESSVISKQAKHTTVYEEIVDVLRPLNEKKVEKEHDYEELEKCRRDIKRSYSFQEKAQPPPLPPRRPQSFSPDPWNETPVSKTKTLRKLFGLSFYNKSHSQDSMLDVENVDFGNRIIAGQLGSDDMATVQALGTLPRIKRKTAERNQDARFGFALSPKMSPKQKLKNPFGISPNRSPRIQRPRNLFIFNKSAAKEDQISPNTQAALKLHKQLTFQALRTPSTDSSLQDAPTPDTPHCNLHRGHMREYAHLDTPDTSDDSTIYSTTARDPSSFLKSPKIVSKTFNFLRKFPNPKDKYSSMERKRKSAIFIQSAVSNDPGKVPSSYSMDNFSMDEGNPNDPEISADTSVRPRAMSFAPTSPAIHGPRRSCCYSSSNVSPAGTPSSCPGTSMSYNTGSLPHAGAPWREESFKETCLPPPPPAPCEPQYANMGAAPDPEYMTVEELQSTFKKGNKDDGGYLSMGDLRAKSTTPTNKKEQQNLLPKPPPIPIAAEQSYVTMHEMQHLKKKEEYPVINCKPNEDVYKHRSNSSPYPPKEKPQSHCHHYNHPPRAPVVYHPPEEPYCAQGYKSAPSSRKPSCCDASDYLTPQEVSRLLRRELVSARVREIPLDSHLHRHPHNHHHHSHYHH